MPKGRFRWPAGTAFRPWPGCLRFVLLASTALALAAASCQKDNLTKPGSAQGSIVVATYIPADSISALFALDGKAVQAEWGGPFNTDWPFTQIRLTAENGSGNPGEPIYLSTKAFYTDTDIFFLFQWTDPQADQMKDAFYYIGPDVTNRPDAMDLLRDEKNWTRSYNGKVWDEDKLAIAFEIQPAGDAVGTFQQQGCQVACHQGSNPEFGRPGYGRLDVWEWLAARTNPLRDLYILTDNPDNPKYGYPGFLEDESADPVAGLQYDAGTPGWIQNWQGGVNRPLFVYRPTDDKLDVAPGTACKNHFLGKCIQNNSIPLYYIFREDITKPIQEFTTQQGDEINQAVLPQGQQPRPWQPGDAVSGYYYTYPTETSSRADVRGKALWSAGIWTLEVGRHLNTGDAINDRIFAWDKGPDATGPDSVAIHDVYFTVATFDNSSSVHWGSAPQILRFGSRKAYYQKKGGL